MPAKLKLTTADIGALIGLGWRPTIPLEEGLRRTIEYFDRLLASG